MSQPDLSAEGDAPLRIVHVTESASFIGGVERLVFDLARGLAERGWPQALVHNAKFVEPEFAKAFCQVGSSLDDLGSFQPDVAYLHKVASTRLIEKLTSAIPTARMFHDHDVVCLRRHKYFPLGSRICNQPTGFSTLR